MGSRVDGIKENCLSINLL